jgi:hypothetical protein
MISPIHQPIPRDFAIALSKTSTRLDKLATRRYTTALRWRAEEDRGR